LLGTVQQYVTIILTPPGEYQVFAGLGGELYSLHFRKASDC